jgi:hypothetical protein
MANTDAKSVRATCDCPDWEEGHKAQLQVCYIAQIHGHPYQGKVAVYCPWCGKKLVIIETEDKD